MGRRTTTRVVSSLVFLLGVSAVLWALFAWRDSRVEAIVEDARPGDVMGVETDVCVVLRERGLIAGNTDCGYRDTVKVRFIDGEE